MCILSLAACACACGDSGPLSRADDLYERGELEQALEIYRQVVEQAPDNPRAHYSIGVVHYSRDDYAAALEAFERAIALDGEQPDYRMLRGHTLVRLRRFAEAIEEYEAVIRLDPSRSTAYYSVGIAYYNERDFGNASRWLKRYLAVAPEAADRERVQGLLRLMDE